MNCDAGSSCQESGKIHFLFISSQLSRGHRVAMVRTLYWLATHLPCPLMYFFNVMGFPGIGVPTPHKGQVHH